MAITYYVSTDMILEVNYFISLKFLLTWWCQNITPFIYPEVIRQVKSSQLFHLKDAVQTNFTDDVSSKKSR